jgi:hypothetical protein
MAEHKIPTYKDGDWSYTEFETRKDLVDFLTKIFMEPGVYDLDETSLLFNEQARNFDKNGFYCAAPIRTKDFMTYWEYEKEKCRNGVIFHSNNKIFYLSRDYYMWLNFLPIFDKEERKYGFAKVRDAQYHMALYETLAELNYKHVAILKKRQIASSYFHMAKVLNLFWFEEGSIAKIGASLKDYINDKGSWKFLDEYRNFLNEHTAWYRPCSPDKVLIWEQKIEVRLNNRKTTRGLNSKIQGMSFEKDATTGVGGPCTIFFHEEAGIAPKMDKTYEYIRPAMSSGMMTTGVFIAAGSVGDLDQCGPLKQMMLYPEINDIYEVETNLLDADGTWGKSGLFIPEQWSMPPFIDEWGNSKVEEALEAIKEERLKWKKDLSPEQYQLRISQKPTNIAEAFAYRKESVFPINLVAAQAKKIEDKEYYTEYIDLERDETDTVIAKRSNRIPISEFPISKKTEDKGGVLCVWERPVHNKPEFGLYYASIDPVSEGKTTTSDSLCSIFVYKNPVEVTRETENGIESFIEGDKIVAAWCGRYDNIKTTHEMLENIIEWYNAWTLVENNISLFIQYMISKRKQRFLVPKNQILFLKDIGSNKSVYQEYGWKNTGTLFKSHLISYAIEFLREEIDVENEVDGTVIKAKYGVERIPDPMLLKEMLAYHPGVNVDRLVAFSALVAFAKVQQSNRGYAKRQEKTTESLEKSDNLYKLKMSPFRHMGGKTSQLLGGSKKSAFKNLK